MAEAVRFYWRGGEAGIPLGEIPEPDRNPLRVRRGVVQACAPDVITHLEEGRFVAAAWESGGSVFLILCHPDLTKGPDDSPLVDSMALPRVVLKQDDWDDIPETANRLLTAFGSEGASVEQCATARRDLAKWLLEHGQSETAATVKRFSAFPFDVRSDALEVIKTWRHVVVKGQKEEIDRFLDDVEQRFKALGWTRDSDFEGRMNRGEYQRNRFYCWASSPNSRPRFRLCLNRATERRIRGGTYDIDIDERATVADLASAIQHVLKDVLEPAAAARGLEISYPRLGPISLVGIRTATAMTALAEAGDGQWPLSDNLEPIWRTFVLTAFRDDAAFHPGELTAWFIASGWDERAAAELTSRFYTDAALLAEYEEAGRQRA